jgi:translation initiation factor 3 subunit M
LFNGLQKDYAARYHVYFYLIRAAMHTGDDSHICLFFKDVPSLKEQFAAAPPTNDQMQKLYRLLHEGLVKANKRYRQPGLVCTPQNFDQSSKF